MWLYRVDNGGDYKMSIVNSVCCGQRFDSDNDLEHIITIDGSVFCFECAYEDADLPTKRKLLSGETDFTMSLADDIETVLANYTKKVDNI